VLAGLVGLSLSATQPTIFEVSGVLHLTIRLTNLGKLQVKPGLLNITKNRPKILTDRDRQTVVTAINNISPPEVGSIGSRWVAYENQLTRTLQFDKAVIAFEKAIAQGEVFQGNDGKTLSLLILRKYDPAKIYIAKAISLVPNDKSHASYYYLWKYQSRIFARLGSYDEAIKVIDRDRIGA
jgi:tetratricopeptide (TPR) repeat protein